MIIENLADFLETNGFGTVATDIFIGEAPAEVDNTVTLVYSPSPEPYRTFDVYEQVVDFWSRSSSDTTAYNLLLNIQDFLHKKTEYTMGDYHVYFSNSLGMIDDMDKDTEGRKLNKLSIRFHYRLEDELAS